MIRYAANMTKIEGMLIKGKHIGSSFMFVSNHIKSFNELIRSSIFSLLRRLQDSENPLFVNYLYTDIHFRSAMLNTGPHTVGI